MKFEAWMLRKDWLFTSWMMGCHQNRDVLLDDQRTIFQSFFINKNNYLMKNLILLEAAFWPTFLAVEKGMVAAGETIF
jgi:hypothetical protein